MAEVQTNTQSGRAVAALHRVRHDAGAERGAFSRANPKSANRQRRSESRAGENVHRSARHDSGKDARQSYERRGGGSAQHALEFADGVRGSFAGRRARGRPKQLRRAAEPEAEAAESSAPRSCIGSSRAASRRAEPKPNRARNSPRATARRVLVRGMRRCRRGTAIWQRSPAREARRSLATEMRPRAASRTYWLSADVNSKCAGKRKRRSTKSRSPPIRPKPRKKPGFVTSATNSRVTRAKRRATTSSISIREGKAIRDETRLLRIRRLAIPPAYTDVWICPSPNGHIQATGRDARAPETVSLSRALARGARRKQIRSHAHFRAGPAENPQAGERRSGAARLAAKQSARHGRPTSWSAPSSASATKSTRGKTNRLA